MLPSITDTDAVAKAKLNNVRALLESQHQENLAAFEGSGYDISGIETLEDVVAAEEAGTLPTVEDESSSTEFEPWIQEMIDKEEITLEQAMEYNQ